MIFGPLIIFHHSVTKTKTLSKVLLCISHDKMHFKNNQNDQKEVNWSPFEHQFYSMVIFLISDGHFPMS